MKKCRPLTLTEVVLSLGLMAMLLAALFSTLRNASLLQIKGETGREKVLARNQLHQRLSQVFFYSDQKTFQVEEDGSLSFSFDNQVDPDMSFSGTIKGKLYLDSLHRVALATFPKAPGESYREEYLLSDAILLDMNVTPPFISITIDGTPFVFPLPRTEKEGLPL